MMVSVEDEQSSLTGAPFVRKQKGYGTTPSTVNSLTGMMKPRSFITHTVHPGDSLPGLAIKYGATVADIKRINKLWNDESLRLRSAVRIPLYDDDVSPPTHESSAASSIDQSMTTKTAAVSSEQGSAADFFAKYDSSFSTLKVKVDKQVSKSARMLSEDAVYLQQNANKGSLSNNEHPDRESMLARSLSEGSRVNTEPVVQTKVKKRLERLEQRQDELYQL